MRKIFLLVSILVGLTLQSKAQSSDIAIEDIEFESASTHLSGTIYTPHNPYAAVVLVHGSDPTPRLSGFALRLAGEGISVLTYDKRGVGKSEGVYVGPEVGTNNVDSANLALLAEDANAAVKTLHQHNKSLPICLLGFSQAGWVIPIAAKGNPTVGFMVLFSGSLIPTLEQLRFQFFTNGRSDFWETHTEAEAREHIRTAPDRYQFTNTDPYDALSVLSIPGLWLFGGKDIQVPVAFSIERLDTLKAQGKPYDYTLFPALGHNTTSSDHTEPFDIAIRWIKNRCSAKQK